VVDFGWGIACFAFAAMDRGVVIVEKESALALGRFAIDDRWRGGISFKFLNTL